jgi:hypothetical protein
MHANSSSYEIANNFPKSKKPKVWMIVYMNVDHAHDLTTRRFIAGTLLMLIDIIDRRVSKNQKTVETLTHGSELVASIIAAELILEV